MTDHDKLREAIRQYREGEAVNTVILMKGALTLIVDAAESTLPKTKMVDRWDVEYCLGCGDTWHMMVAVWDSLEDAEIFAKGVRSNPYGIYACVRVTGPHKHEVPE